jgi:hypothetical protein
MIDVSGDISPPRSSPRGVIKGARPPTAHFRLAGGAHGTLRQDGEPRGPQTRFSLHRRDGRDRA